MHPVELSQVTAIVEALAPKRCLEWGSGGSTRQMLEQFPFIERYVSVEHQAEWCEKVRKAVADPRLSLNLVPPDKPLGKSNPSRTESEAWDARAEQDPSVLRSYVGFPATLEQTFDFVLVDGRARCFCLRAGFDLLRAGGVIVLHDAQREQYHAAVKALGRAVFLAPWHQGQVCLVRKD
jgi:predicted O-methyltransferase YrrM